MDENGITALHWAAVHLNWDAAKHLVSRGADVSLEDIKGRTPKAWLQAKKEAKKVGLTNEQVLACVAIEAILTKDQSFNHRDDDSERTAGHSFSPPSQKPLQVAETIVYAEASIAFALLFTLILARSDPWQLWEEANWAEDLLNTDVGLLTLKSVLAVCVLVAAPLLIYRGAKKLAEIACETCIDQRQVGAPSC
jgi:hypothetical protein